MTGAPARVAVDVGTATLRVAAAEPGGAPHLLARFPLPPEARGSGALFDDRVAAAVAEVLGRRPRELVVVLRSSGAGPRPGWFALADEVHTVPAAVAAGAGRRLVVDVGQRGARLTVLDETGVAVRTRCSTVGGTRLDDAVAELLGAGSADPGTPPRRVREKLSLMPSASVRGPDGDVRIDAGEVRASLAPILAELVDAARAVLSDEGPVPVLLIGGVARTPLLAELFDRAGCGPVTVAVRPDVAAVLGALRLPAAAMTPLGGGPAEGGSPDAVCRLPPPRRRRFRLAGAAAAAGVLPVVAMLGAGPAEPPPGVVVAQYGYAAALPPGWAHTGGLPERRRILLTLAAAPEGSDLVVVERSTLGYDTAAEPARAVAELRAVFESAASIGATLSGFTPGVRIAGREVVTYTERGPVGVIDWFVVFDGTDQLSVGCQHTAAGLDRVRRACEVVLGSVHRT